MTIQLELPLFEQIPTSTDNPLAEQERTHPAQMVIQHCGKSRQHVSHARHEVGGWVGCPGTPDLRDAATVTAADQVREQIRQMELRTYGCKGAFHAPHTINGVTCPGLIFRPCGTQDRHHHHRWWSIPDAFYWCEGTQEVRVGRDIENVELPNEP